MPKSHDHSRPPSHHLKFHRLHDSYAVVRLEPHTAIPEWATKGEFTSITRTPDELSIVCPSANLPPAVHSAQRWTCLKLQGPFAFSLTGVLLSFLAPLSENEVPIFAVSTYDTDYVLIQEEFSEKALEVLQRAGHELQS